MLGGSANINVNAGGIVNTNVVGGFSADWKPITPNVEALVAKHRPDVEAKMGQTFEMFEAVEYSPQVVNGTNYKVKVKTSADAHVEMVVYETLPCNGATTELSSCVAL